nr:unnamed protein product [Digitaria exilis]
MAEDHQFLDGLPPPSLSSLTGETARASEGKPPLLLSPHPLPLHCLQVEQLTFPTPTTHCPPGVFPRSPVSDCPPVLRFASHPVGRPPHSRRRLPPAVLLLTLVAERRRGARVLGRDKAVVAPLVFLGKCVPPSAQFPSPLLPIPFVILSW